MNHQNQLSVESQSDQTTPSKATHDYVRNGTVDLFAALNIATGTVITDLRKSHTAADFIAFLNKIDTEVPAELDVHVILDNLSTHKTPEVHPEPWRVPYAASDWRAVVS